MIRKQIAHYNESWSVFERYCRKKAEGRCYLNNNAWRKLRDFHLDHFLQDMENPWKFLFMIRVFHYDMYKNTPNMHKYYVKYSKINKNEVNDSWTSKYCLANKNVLWYYKTIKGNK